MKKNNKRVLKLGKKTITSLQQNQVKGMMAGGTFGCTRGGTCTNLCPSNLNICR